jgi:hypothetical protein
MTNEAKYEARLDSIDNSAATYNDASLADTWTLRDAIGSSAWQNAEDSFAIPYAGPCQLTEEAYRVAIDTLEGIVDELASWCVGAGFTYHRS